MPPWWAIFGLCWRISKLAQHKCAKTIPAGVMEKPHVLLLALAGSAEEESEARLIQKTESESLVYCRVRRQIVERGSTRHRGNRSIEEGHQRARISRLDRQLAIVERYRREKARHDARLKTRDELPEDAQKSLAKNDTVTSQPVTRFPRKTSLRQLQLSSSNVPSTNQDEGLSELTASPTISDIAKFAALASQPIQSRYGPSCAQISAGSTHITTQKIAKRNDTSSRMQSDKSTAQVLCELKIMKDIMLREHLVSEIREVITFLTTTASDLHDITQRKAKSESTSASTGQTSSSRRPSNSISTSTQAGSPLNQLSCTDLSKREPDTTDLETRYADLVHRSQQRITKVLHLIASVRATTISIVQSIHEWRVFKAKPSTISNVEKLHRFPWKKRNVPNYLIHLDSDLRDLFPSPAISVLLGANAKYNPLLLPRATLDALGIQEDLFVSTTFLTERQDTSLIPSSEPLGRDAPSPTKRQAYVALHNAVRSTDIAKSLNDSLSQLNADDVRKCLEAIKREHELERKADELRTAEKQRLESVYNPFESIKMAGGVEDAMAKVLSDQVKANALEHAERLRRRQEDTTRAKERAHDHNDHDGNSNHTSHALHVNPARIRRLIEQRKEEREVATDCELHETTAAWKRNKLRGQVMVRRMNIRRMENQHARKIQRQFLVYRRRTQLLKNLAHFVVTSRQRVVSIQKMVRGYIAKKRYQEARRWHEEKCRRRMAAKTIWHAYKRYRRRLRHRHSMSVEAVAQIQLLHVIQQQLEDAETNDSSAERFRKLGEERRRQRAVHLYKRRQELLELEAKRTAAAVRIQSIYRTHLAKKLVLTLHGERRAHMSAVSAMMIQSKIRKFLKRQEKRRQRFRSDMERVNRSAIRIQSIYRGYNSRAGLMDELNALAKHNSGGYAFGISVDEDEEEDDDDDEMDHISRDGQDVGIEREHSSGVDESYVVLPPIINSRPSTASSRASTPAPQPQRYDQFTNDEEKPHEKSAGGVDSAIVQVAAPAPTVSLPPIRSRAQSVEPSSLVAPRKAQPPPPVHRQLPTGMTKVELKLKETTLGDDLDANTAATSNGTPRGGFLGPFRRRLSGTSTVSRRGNVNDSSG